MDIYLLNDRFFPESVLSSYESFIWSERFIPDNDFELVMSKEDSRASGLQPGRFINHSETHRVCVVTTREETRDVYGAEMVTWTGQGLERWLFDRRSSFRTRMPTYRWSRTPHSSASIERYKGSVTDRNDFINPHFLVGDTATPFRNVGNLGSGKPEDFITGNLRVSNGAIALSGVSADNASYRGFGYKMTKQRISAPLEARQFTFSFSVSDVFLSAGARVIVVLDFFNSSYNKISTMSVDSPTITEDGRYHMTTPLHSFAPTFYDATFIIDNRLNPTHATITDCSATFHSPSLKAGTTPGEFFAGDSSYLMLHPQRVFSNQLDGILEEIIDATVLDNQDWSQENLPLVKGYPAGEPMGGYNAAPFVDIPDVAVDVFLSPSTVFEALESVCEEYDLGWGIFLDRILGKLHIETFGGTNRTVRAEGGYFTPIVYDPDLDTLKDVSILSSIENRYDLAVVYGKYDYVICDILGSETEHQEYGGLDRELLVVDATSIDLPHGTQELKDVLIAKGREALASHQRIMTLDGTVTDHVPYIYEQQFAVGSMVSVRDGQGFEAEMRVSEYIFISDKEGYRAYPTLKENKYINPGTWEAVKPSLVWNTATGTWEEQ